jgi:hypothetical protein
MSYPINYPTPQGANIQTFYKTSAWVKPQGASFVWFTLIGGGGGGDGSSTGGGSGGVTNCMVPAFLIPDELRIEVGLGGLIGGNGAVSRVYYQGPVSNNGYVLLTAGNGTPGTGGSAQPSNYFSCMGFYQSIAGQAGSSSTVNASATTFLSGGASGGQVDANYGYRTTNGYSGRFQTQPIIVGNGGSVDGTGGIGCGGGLTGPGGNGLVVIITW